jgi:hypothetical protein
MRCGEVVIVVVAERGFRIACELDGLLLEIRLLHHWLL